MASEKARALRSELRRVLPPESFRPQRWRGVAAFAQTVAFVALGVWAARHNLPWPAELLVAVVIGQMMTSVALTAHEALHHSVFRSRFLEELLGWVGLSPFLVTPGLWSGWHVQAHHGAANTPGLDPDMLGSLEVYRQSRFARFIHRVTPGSGHPLSYVSFTFLFTMQGQLFLWHYSGRPEFSHVKMARARERVLTVLLALGWGALAYALGPVKSVYLVLLPMVFGNITLMAYISTNHWLRQASAGPDDPFVNTMSVITHPLADLVHMNFSYHQEHHIFPSMSPRFAPLLRQELRKLDPRASVAFPHGRVLRAVFKTPALYLDPHQLVRCDGEARTHVAEVERALGQPRVRS